MGLISANRTLRPFDNAVYLENAQNSTFSWIGTDETTAVDALDPNTADLSVAPTPITESVTKQHESSEDGKFNGSDRNSTRNPLTGRRIIQELIDKKCAFVPVSIDEFAQLGPAFYRLWNPHQSPYKNDSATERIESPTLRHDTARSAAEATYHPDCPNNLIGRADAEWKKQTAEEKMLNGRPTAIRDTWYTHTYHAQTPRQWAEQVLSFNVSVALASHFHNATLEIARQHHDVHPGTKRRRFQIPGSDPESTMAPPRKRKMPTYTTAELLLSSSNTSSSSSDNEPLSGTLV